MLSGLACTLLERGTGSVLHPYFHEVILFLQAQLHDPFPVRDERETQLTRQAGGRTTVFFGGGNRRSRWSNVHLSLMLVNALDYAAVIHRSCASRHARRWRCWRITASTRWVKLLTAVLGCEPV